MSMISHGLNADTSPIMRIDREHDKIVWPSGNSLEYVQGPSQYWFVYRNANTWILNSFVHPETRIYPVSGFFQYVVGKRGVISNDHPEVHLLIPELRKDENAMLEALHEIGHDRYFARLSKEAGEHARESGLGSDESGYAGRYRASYGARLLAMCNHLNRQPDFEVRSERMAWSEALKIARHIGMDVPFRETRERIAKHLRGYGNRKSRRSSWF